MQLTIGNGVHRGQRRGHSIWHFCTGLALVASPVAAQTPAQRVEVEAFRDSIAPLTDSITLVMAEKRLIARASREARDSAMVHLRLGFLALRLGDLAGKKHYDDAASEFQWVVDLQPKWPYGWFGLGLAELGVGDAEFAVLRGIQSALGKDALTRSASDFAKSAEVDPGFVRGLVELSNTALRQRVNLRLDVALAALRRAARTPAARNSDVLLVRARVEREVGSVDSALVAIDSLVSRSPANATALLELARVRFRLGRRDGGDPWYRGLAGADAAALELYRYDLRFVLPDSTARAFDAATGAARAELMHRFWERRDYDELHAPGDRLVEHYRRLDMARHSYRLASTHRRYDIVERYRPPVAEFDDRGVIYIRQGTPDDRATLEQPGVPYNESWVYHRKGGPDLLLHFVAREGVTDYRLVESVLDILGYANAVRLENTGNIQGTDLPGWLPTTGSGAPISSDSAAKLRQRLGDAAMSRNAETILRSRERISPIYQRMLVSGRGGASGLQAEERALGSRSIRIGTTTDSWERRYEVDLPADVQILAGASDSVHPVIRVVYAIPATALPPASRRGGAGISPRIRVSVLGLDGVVTGAADTLGTPVPAAGPGARDYLYGLVSVAVPPGRQTVRVGLEADRAGVVSQRDTVDVPAPVGPALSLSDIAIGARSVPVTWLSAAGDSVWVNPTATFHISDPISVYYEASGLVPGASYQVRLLIKPAGGVSFFKRLLGVFGGGGVPVRIESTVRAAAPQLVVAREIGLEKLKPASYVLEVTISGSSGSKVTRHQEFTVVR